MVLTIELFELLSKPKLVLLWKLFLQHQNKEFTQTQILQTTGLAKATGIKWLRTLCQYSIISVQPRGPTKYYTLVINPINKLLKVTATVAFLRPLSAINAEVFLYGSAARGEDTEESDIDILVIGKITKQSVLKITEPVSKQIKRAIKPIIMTPLHWAALRSKDPAFYERVEKDKIKITWT